MVGIVIVSHSAKVADGVKEMAEQMAGSGQRIIAAGGLEDSSLGTDAIKISAAISAADSPDGVAVLVDLGSAVLSAETALELLDETVRQRVRIADAPLLEGSIVAAVQAAAGDPLTAVVAAAEETREFKKI